MQNIALIEIIGVCGTISWMWSYTVQIEITNWAIEFNGRAVGKVMMVIRNNLNKVKERQNLGHSNKNDK